MRLIDADALLDEVMERHCKECDKRKGIKNGKYRIIYEIGDAPCRACDVDDLKGEIEDAPTIEPRCEACEAFNKTRLLIPQPQRKKGKWIKYEQEFRLEGQLETVQKTVRECSICRTKIAGMVGIMNFCPNCGARMEGK